MTYQYGNKKKLEEKYGPLDADNDDEPFVLKTKRHINPNAVFQKSIQEEIIPVKYKKEIKKIEEKENVPTLIITLPTNISTIVNPKKLSKVVEKLTEEVSYITSIPQLYQFIDYSKVVVKRPGKHTKSYSLVELKYLRDNLKIQKSKDDKPTIVNQLIADYESRFKGDINLVGAIKKLTDIKEQGGELKTLFEQHNIDPTTTKSLLTKIKKVMKDYSTSEHDLIIEKIIETIEKEWKM